MKKQRYTSPTLTDYGNVSELTGIFGSASTGDVLVDLNGNVVQQGDQSINACPTSDFRECQISS